jgi:DNA-binding NtrC family response regulator
MVPMGKILVVDDEPLILYAISKALHDCAEVKTVTTAEQALEEVGSTFYNLCFLDIFLPGLNGLDAMKKINEISPGTKVAIMTASHLDDDMKSAIKKSAYHFIAKPFNLVQIREVAKHALQGPETLADGFVSFKGGYKEQRRSERRPVMKTFKYSMSVLEPGELKMLELEGDVIDISETGMGIRTPHRLEPGRLLRFEEDTQPKAGIVKWCMLINNGTAYRAGIQLV